MKDQNFHIVDKIKNLFEYRKIFWLLSQSQIENQPVLIQQLTNLQAAIYELDWQLENQWAIELRDLKTCWLNIYSRLSAMGLSENQQRTWTKEIERYQNRELDLRQGISPLKHSMEDLYNFKSCDVRLMRRLIYKEVDSLNKVLRFSEWSEFDLITEVNDDIDDLYEDLAAFNANRFLFSLHELGPLATRERFETFIKEKSKSLCQKLETSSSSARRQMQVWIENIAMETLGLLDDRLSNLNSDHLRASEVIVHFEQIRSVPGIGN
jgi:hypothetical protein